MPRTDDHPFPLEPRAVVDAFFDRMNAHDTEGVLALIDEDVEWWIAGNLPFSGQRTKLEVSSLIPMVFGVFPDFKFVVHSVICEGNRVAVEAESFATRPDGQRYNNRYHDLFEVDGGRIRAAREYYDTLHTSEVMLGG
jgi:ketosteroid isomerase-like protein